MKKLLFTLFATLFTLNVASQEIVTSGTIGGITWNFSQKENTLTISGSGSIPDYEPNKAPWLAVYRFQFGESYIPYTWKEDIYTIKIGDGIKHIGDNSFNGLSNLTKVEFPTTSLTSIGSNAFAGCTSLETISVPESVNEFGTQVFSGCEELTSTCKHIIIKADLEKLEEDGTYTIPYDVKYIEQGAFNVFLNSETGLKYLIYEGCPKVGGDIATSQIMNNITTTSVPSKDYNSFNVDKNGFSSYGNNVNKTSVKVKKDKYTSYAFLHDVAIPTGVVAYTATTDGSVVTLHPITEGTIKAEEGVYLKSTADDTYTFTNGVGAKKINSNQLQGEIKATTLYPKDNAYVMQTKGGVQKFYKVNDALNLARFKAWLKFDGGEGVKMFSIFDENTTDIEETEENEDCSANSRTEVYNMAGQKLSAPQKGLNIINGKIVIN